MLRTIHFWMLLFFFICKVHRKTSVENPYYVVENSFPINIQATRIAVSRVHPSVDRCPVCLRHTCCRNRLDPQMLQTRCWFDRISTVQQLDARDECTTVFPMVFFIIFSLLDTGWCVCFLLRPTVSILSNFSGWKNMLMLDLAKEMMLEMQSEDSDRAFLGLHPWKLIWQWKFPKLSRCVSYWKWWFFSLSC